ncbi:MAG: ribose 5-phosphate isomerase B [Deltaproteobacteria bacterium]|nr:MAG: ribose 5-phosphate isomerase B [Deltaproteobacteria bacterium]
MNVIIGSDHAGFDLKEEIKRSLTEKGEYPVTDMGTFSNAPVDYPIIAHQVAKNISEKRFHWGILVCGSGIGMSIVANRYPRVRAALCSNLFAVKVSRQHNDANILVLGGRVLGIDLALEMVDLFLHTQFEGGRHQRRLEQIERAQSGEGGPQ